jgi:hypothetical protein
MASFTDFSFTYDDSAQKYVFSYSYATGLDNFTINASINSSAVGSLSDESTGTIDVLESAYPNFFTQGYTIEAFLNCPTEDVQSASIYGIFQRKTDSNNIYLNGNPKFVITAGTSSDIKSVVLAPISEFPYTQFYMKYLNPNAPFSFCPYMCNAEVSYPITTSQFISTVGGSADFGAFFDSLLNNKYEAIQFRTDQAGYCTTIMNDTSNWFITCDYINSVTVTSIAPPAALIDSNRQILFYEWVTGSNSIALASNSFGYTKYISVRNTDTNTQIINLIAPSGVNIDNTAANPGERAVIQFEVPQNYVRTVGVFYDKPQNRYIVLSDYDGSDITSNTPYPASNSQMKASVVGLGFKGFTDTNLKFSPPIQESGYAMINTIFAPYSKSTTPFTLTVSTDQTTGYAIYYTGGSNQSVVLSNQHPRSISYTFATFYYSASSNSISIPIYRKI